MTDALYALIEETIMIFGGERIVAALVRPLPASAGKPQGKPRNSRRSQERFFGPLTLLIIQRAASWLRKYGPLTLMRSAGRSFLRGFEDVRARVRRNAGVC